MLLVLPARSSVTLWHDNVEVKGKLVPTGPVCWDCGETSAQGYGHMTVAQVCDKRKTNEEFNNGFKAANSVRLGKSPPDFVPQEVGNQVMTGTRASKRYVALTVDEFQKKFGSTPKIAGYKVDHDIPDEHGNIFSGVLFKDEGKPHPYRTVEKFSLTQMCLTDFLSTQSKQIRNNQGSDVYDWMANGDFQKSMCQRLKKGVVGKVTTLSEAEIEIPVTVKKADVARKAKEQDLSGSFLGVRGPPYARDSEILAASCTHLITVVRSRRAHSPQVDVHPRCGVLPRFAGALYLKRLSKFVSGQWTGKPWTCVNLIESEGAGGPLAQITRTTHKSGA
jgi:hypothetical protein